jgi:trimethylamine--corrinoid protein Co-methyltransferase
MVAGVDDSNGDGDASSGRGRRGGGGASRRASRTAVTFETARYITRKIMTYDILDDESVAIIRNNADIILEEIGINFPENPEALKRWKDAGADVKGEKVHFPKGFVEKLCSTAPSSFEQNARNIERSVVIGGKNTVFAPVYGPPFVRDMDNGRRYATLKDFENFVKLGYMSKYLHHSGGTLCEPTDLPVNKRHLDMLYSHIKYSDKPFMGSVTAPERALDSVNMARIALGESFDNGNPSLISLINVNSPLTFDNLMLSSLEVYAEHNQAVILSPFIVGGAMSPVAMIGTLSQILAEVMTGIAYSQLIRKGAPIVFGAFVASIDMSSGAPIFGTPEATKILYGAAQLARRMNLPFRSGGGLCGSKMPDAQAGYEACQTLNTTLLAGVNFALHSAGWLEGGLVSGYEKFVMDADQLGALHRLADGVDISENGQAMDAFREVGPGGHFLGCDHTQRNYKDAFWSSNVFDYRPYEAWSEAGSPITSELANTIWKKKLNDYQPPPLDPSVDEALLEYIAKKKNSLPDSIV